MRPELVEEWSDIGMEDNKMDDNHEESGSHPGILARHFLIII